jgi:hypothetical protein
VTVTTMTMTPAVADRQCGGGVVSTISALDLERVWSEAIPYDAFVQQARQLCGLWDGVYRKAKLPDWALERAREHGRHVRLLVIAEDWCWDAANAVPYLARLSDETDALPIRVVRRDERPDVMDHYLTNGARAIPIVIALDDQGCEIGHWGSRPHELQQWAQEHKSRLSKDEFYKQMRIWHVRDRGTSVLQEVLDLLP